MREKQREMTMGMEERGRNGKKERDRIRKREKRREDGGREKEDKQRNSFAVRESNEKNRGNRENERWWEGERVIERVSESSQGKMGAEPEAQLWV